jgi:hypothetical protein
MTRFGFAGSALLIVLALLAATTVAAEEGFLPVKPKEATITAKTVSFHVGPAIVLCTQIDLASSVIKFENDKHGKGTLRILGCFSAGMGFNSLGDSRGEILMPILLLICLEPKNSAGKVLGEFAIAVEVEKVHLEIPAIGGLFELNGRLLGLMSAKAGESLKEFSVAFRSEKEHQEVASCKEGKSEKTNTLTAEENEGLSGALTENTEGYVIEFTEAQQLMDS